LLRSADDSCRYLDGGDGLMGVEDNQYETFRESLGHGGTLVFYTDGLIERRSESLDAGLDRLVSAASAGPQEPGALCEHILGQLLEPATQRYDDVTAVVARVSG
jgi:serine phosphatase RsbU (regulator of sigma subunit)